MRVEVRRRVDVEELLHWTYREEMPKGIADSRGRWSYGGDGVSPMFRNAVLGTRVDEGRGEPGFPTIMGEAHPDAVEIDKRVVALADASYDWPASRRNILGNFAALVDDRDPALSALKIGRSGLVAMHARLRSRPHWDRAPVFEPVIGRNGKAAVKFLDDDGRTLIEGRKGRHYGPMARCDLIWVPPPREIAYSRLEYVAWHEALVELAESLAGALCEHEVLAPAAPAWPWFR